VLQVLLTLVTGLFAKPSTERGTWSWVGLALASGAGALVPILTWEAFGLLLGVRLLKHIEEKSVNHLTECLDDALLAEFWSTPSLTESLVQDGLINEC
jgi:hypothetical protein